MKSTILDENLDENYEPTTQEIHEYAKFLGMDPSEDSELLWIARESLKAPLPENWRPCQTEEGDIYYFNFKTGESLWDHPCDNHYKELFKREKEKLLLSRAKKGSKELLAPIKMGSKEVLQPLKKNSNEPFIHLKSIEKESLPGISILGNNMRELDQEEKKIAGLLKLKSNSSLSTLSPIRVKESQVTSIHVESVEISSNIRRESENIQDAKKELREIQEKEIEKMKQENSREIQKLKEKHAETVKEMEIMHEKDLEKLQEDFEKDKKRLKEARDDFKSGFDQDIYKESLKESEEEMNKNLEEEKKRIMAECQREKEKIEAEQRQVLKEYEREIKESLQADKKRILDDFEREIKEKLEKDKSKILKEYESEKEKIQAAHKQKLKEYENEAKESLQLDKKRLLEEYQKIIKDEKNTLEAKKQDSQKNCTDEPIMHALNNSEKNSTIENDGFGMSCSKLNIAELFQKCNKILDDEKLYSKDLTELSQIRNGDDAFIEQLKLKLSNYNNYSSNFGKNNPESTEIPENEISWTNIKRKEQESKISMIESNDSAILDYLKRVKDRNFLEASTLSRYFLKTKSRHVLPDQIKKKTAYISTRSKWMAEIHEQEQFLRKF